MKRILFLLGICLLTLAFLTTGAELAARGIHGPENTSGVILLPLSEVWEIVAPASFAALQNSSHWGFYALLLAVPGWILFGVPGLALVITCRSRDQDAQDQDLEESLYLFDELASAAGKEGYDHLPDDLAPSNPADTVPADEHYANDPIDAELMPQRDFLLDPTPHIRGDTDTKA